MNRLQWIASVAIGALVALPACQEQTAGPTAADYQQQRAAVLEKHKSNTSRALAGGAKAAEAEQDEASGDALVIGDAGFVYDPIGKRDPFRSFLLQSEWERDQGAESPLEKFDLSQLDVAGVIWRADKRRALILDPSGQAFVVAEGDRIGKNSGHVIEIGDSRMLVKEAYVDFHGEQTTKEIEMRIRQSQGG